MSQKTSAERKTLHIWMTDTRSLCDRRAAPVVRLEDFTDDAEFDSHLTEIATAPACGACLLLAGRIRRQASALLAEQTGVYPDDPRDAWASLQNTRWAQMVDLESFLQRGDLHEIRYEAINEPPDPASVRQLVTETQNHRRALRSTWNEYQKQQKEKHNDDQRP